MSAIIVISEVATGVFFAISGFHKLFNKCRHKILVETLKANGIPFIGFNQYWVPFVETSAGATLAISLLLQFSFPFAHELIILSSLGLMTICVIACMTDGRKRIKEWHPINAADVIDDWLYLPETLYLLFLVQILIHHSSILLFN